MRNMLKYLGATMAIATGISILACGGTGAPAGGEACTFDDECSVGFICNTVTNECEQGCVDDNDCPIDTYCVDRVGSDGKKCDTLPVSNNTTNNNFNPNNTSSGECVDNEDCTAFPDGICVSNVCEYPPDMTMSYKVIKIEDVSSGDAACGPNTGDPGSDLIAVSLSNSNGETIAWGEVVNNELGQPVDSNEFTSPIRLDGSPQSLRDGQCPQETTFADTDVYAMGCGGWITIKFSDSQGIPLDIEEDFLIEVYEYGGFCSKSMNNDSEGADEYEVYLCTDTESALGGSDFNCDYDISRGASKGLGQFDVSLP